MSTTARGFRSAVAGRLRYLLIALPIVVSHNLVHEAVHYALARAFGEGVLEFRFLTNGLGSSQVVYATPVPARAGAHWLLIAWGPSAVTTGLGYLIYGIRRRLGGGPTLAAASLYAGFFCLLLDPVYLSVLSVVVGGDVEAAAAVGWSAWPVRAVVLPIVILNAALVRRWLHEARGWVR